MPVFNAERAATILVDALFTSDAIAAHKHAVSPRAIRKWRAKLTEDAHFAALFHKKRQEAERGWAEQLTASIRAAVMFIERSAQELDARDPDAVRAVAEALKVLTEVALTREVLTTRQRG